MECDGVSVVNGDINSSEHDYIRVKINSSRENKVKGFYLLMTNGNTYSDKKDEFIIERRFLKLLRGRSTDLKSVTNVSVSPIIADVRKIVGSK